MLKKLVMLCVALALSLSAGFAAAVEVNSADQAALESVKGIGPVHAKAIIDERSKNGPFKSADDLATRVKGIGTKSVTNLEAAGLTINGSSAPPSGVKTPTKAASKTIPGPATATATPATTAAPAATPAPAPTATDAASGAKPSKSKRKSKAAAASDAAEPATATASAPADASGSKTSKKKAKKSKAASAAAASGGA
ncbi:ComEA family DNA-binding protein [Paraburkholderia sp. BCC1886]|uniref:ComEA family DNA-binding protein n=1 Tax=Paraburkholderia sp. BCC1886 TaxID=2562670 RepID=UPI001183B6D8|nr:helix-hairpin-helix domain-containing protein [Paraburkholderia sp. BCC1886]